MSVEILLMSCMSVWRFRDELSVCVFSCVALDYIAFIALRWLHLVIHFKRGRPIKEDDERRLYDYNWWAGICAMGLAFSYRYGGDGDNGGVRSLTRS